MTQQQNRRSSNAASIQPTIRPAEDPPLNVMEIFVNSKFKRPAMANMMLYEGKVVVNMMWITSRFFTQLLDCALIKYVIFL